MIKEYFPLYFEFYCIFYFSKQISYSYGQSYSVTLSQASVMLSDHLFFYIFLIVRSQNIYFLMDFLIKLILPIRSDFKT